MNRPGGQRQEGTGCGCEPSPEARVFLTSCRLGPQVLGLAPITESRGSAPFTSDWGRPAHCARRLQRAPGLASCSRAKRAGRFSTAPASQSLCVPVSGRRAALRPAFSIRESRRPDDASGLPAPGDNAHNSHFRSLMFCPARPPNVRGDKKAARVAAVGSRSQGRARPRVGGDTATAKKSRPQR